MISGACLAPHQVNHGGVLKPSQVHVRPPHEFHKTKIQGKTKFIKFSWRDTP